IWGCVLLIALLFSGVSFGQTETLTNNPGTTQTWTVPDCVYEITVEAWGAGGGGGRATSNGRTTGGGGGGAYASSVIAVTPGQVINYQIGVGGNGANGTKNGGNTWFATNGTLRAQGGRGATNNIYNGSGQ